MALTAYYSAGTATLTNGSAAVVGIGTAWTTNNLAPGDQIESDAGERATILSINSPTSITLDKNFGGTAQAAAPYKIWRTFDAQYLMEGARNAFNLLGAGSVAALAELAGSADKGMVFTAPNVLALFSLTMAGRALLDDADASTQLSTLGFSAFGKTLIDDADASAALNTLGFSAYFKTLVAAASGVAVQAAIGVREVLTANRTYYVRPDGNNNNNGLANSAAGAFLTLQKAVNVALTLDMAGFNVTIQVGAGTYTGGVSLSKPFAGGQVFIVGDTGTPANVVVSTTSNHCFLVDGGGVRLSIAGLKMQTTTAGQCVWATNKGQVSIDGKVEFGVCAGGHILADNDGQVQVNASYNVTGGAAKHWWSEAYGLVACVGKTLTITGNPAFSQAFAYAFGGYLNVPVNTFSGSATGARYLASLNGVINTNNAGTSYLPGNAAGSGTNPGTSPYGLYN